MNCDVVQVGRGHKSADPKSESSSWIIQYTNWYCRISETVIFYEQTYTYTCPSALQRQLNKVRDTLQTLNESDMARQRLLVKDMLEFSSYAHDTQYQ